jgi:hypothetical protein
MEAAMKVKKFLIAWIVGFAYEMNRLEGGEIWH